MSCKFFTYKGHDSSITEYVPNENFIIHELSKISGIKHFFYRQRKDHYEELKTKITSGQLCMTKWGTKVLGPNHSDVGGEQNWSRDPKDRSFLDHHECHAWGAFAQSPFKHDRAFILAYDGGGDSNCTLSCGIDAKKGLTTIDRPTASENIINHSPDCITRIWSEFGLQGSFKKSIGVPQGSIANYCLDISGKIMGLSAYGKEHHQVESYINNLMMYGAFGNNAFVSSRHVGSLLDLFEPDEEDLAYALQKNLENVVLSYLKQFDFNEWNNNLILTGGCALNVLVNELIRENFPNVDVWVPPNPDDSGISHGVAVYDLWSKGNPDWSLPVIGAPLNDIPLLETHIRTKECIQISEISDLIDSGKILGIIEGQYEIGPRALGRRSIICDPSRVNMKDVLNSKVKFREWYRPFAPFVRKENVEKYFETLDYRWHDFMSFAVKVRGDTDRFPAITHVDNTARIQTVSEGSGFFYDILGHTQSEVLLNTSFNIQGKPTLNSIEDALWILDNTELDHVLVVHEGNYYLF